MIVSRETDWMGSNGPLEIIINNAPIASIENHQSQKVALKNGTYQMRVKAKFFEQSKSIEVNHNSNVTIRTSVLFKWFYFAALSIPLWGGALIYNDNGWNVIGILMIIIGAVVGLKYIPAFDLEVKSI